MNQILELAKIVTHDLGCLLIQWISWIRIEQQENQAVDDVLDVEDRTPRFLQDVQADVAMQIDIRMPDLWNP